MNQRSTASHPLLLGHRGARVRSISENTFAAFDRCLADGGDGFEFDVRISADGAAVVCHNPRARRIEIAKAMAERLPFLPRLEDVLQRYRDSAFLDIELKVLGLEKITVELLRRHPPRQGFVVSSFLPDVLEALHAEDADLQLGLICETRRQLVRWTTLPCAYVIPHFKLADAALVEEIHAAGKKILVWTVNDRRRMARFRKLGVDGLISDNPRSLRKTLMGTQ